MRNFILILWETLSRRAKGSQSLKKISFTNYLRLLDEGSIRCGIGSRRVDVWRKLRESFDRRRWKWMKDRCWRSVYLYGRGDLE
jgi:hypothetical protein